jgi:hypothetical protein
METLVRDFPGLRTSLLVDDRVRAIITLNGHTLDPQTALNTPVYEKYQIVISPPILGG